MVSFKNRRKNSQCRTFWNLLPSILYVKSTFPKPLDFSKQISRKILVAEKSSNFHTVILVSSTFHFLNFLFNEVLCCGNRLLRSGYTNNPVPCSGWKIAFFWYLNPGAGKLLQLDYRASCKKKRLIDIGISGFRNFRIFRIFGVSKFWKFELFKLLKIRKSEITNFRSIEWVSEFRTFQWFESRNYGTFENSISESTDFSEFGIRKFGIFDSYLRVL